MNYADKLKRDIKAVLTNDDMRAQLKKAMAVPRYFVSMYTDGPSTRWNVIDRQTQEWIIRHDTQEAAQADADRRNARNGLR